MKESPRVPLGPLVTWHLGWGRDERLVREQQMLVVLPFENLGPPEDEYFADGITEEKTARLAVIHGLGVIPPADFHPEARRDLRPPPLGPTLPSVTQRSTSNRVR